MLMVSRRSDIREPSNSNYFSILGTLIILRSGPCLIYCNRRCSVTGFGYKLVEWDMLSSNHKQKYQSREEVKSYSNQYEYYLNVPGAPPPGYLETQQIAPCGDYLGGLLKPMSGEFLNSSDATVV